MDIQKDIIDWLKTLKGWQTELAYRILTKKIEDTDIDDIITMAKSNLGFEDKDFPNFLNSNTEKQIRLLSIESIQNIESLAPRNPLKLEKEKNLTVIYGSNGSGKSGYTKIIKKISGKPRAIDLKSNVFNPNPNGKCLIKYSIDGVEQEKEWSINDSQILDLRTVDVFDTTIGNSYVDEENTITYTPQFVKLFTALTYYYSKIQEKLEQEQSKLTKALSNLPNEYALTDTAKIYNNLRKEYTEQQLANILLWDKEKEQARLDIEKRLKEKDPAKSASDLRKQKLEIDKIIKEISDAYTQINTEAIKEIKALKNDAISKRKVSQDSVQVIANKSELQGVGSQVWKSLWEAARVFSIQEAYKTKDYPHVDNEARCVLCHQPLDINAKERLLSFETFIKSQLENEATQAEKKYSEIISKLPVRINREILSTKCIAANLNEDWLNCLVNIWQQIETASNSIKQDVDVTIDAKFISENVSILNSISVAYEKSAIQFETDAKQFDRVKASKELLELNAKKWSSEQKENILKEISRLKKIADFDNWISQCNTRSITAKASQISETAITEEYVKRFNAELLNLNAKKIKVELVKQRAIKGTVTHSLKLKGINGYKPSDILSEGEHRIIALASFLADVTGGNNNNSFVFDDPISSLDQQFEEKTIERLIELSKTRQVIVFTHRLSLLGQLNEKCDSNSIQIIGIRNEHWGAGEIGETPLFAKKTNSALNSIKNDRIAKAKKIFNEQGSEAYYPYGKALCSDIRILVERIVELDFLADVIQRYRRAVNTMGKIQKLAKIQKEDCDIVDDFMTRYSCFEHSQPTETPIEIPEPVELEKDIDKLLQWLTEFNSRV
ncbi:MAG: AAA family ATPase [Paludibacteraceae bacterium]|nr:AAA family ATPase [Paludibacteraceae bacterium]